jgi:hypothetical protein
MRDINRIDKVTDELNKLWKEKYPDFRFGQLVYLLADKLFENSKGNTDIFFPEDDKWLEVIEKLNNNNK